MKKADKYFKFMSSEDSIINLYEGSKEDFIKAIKQAQIDAIEYTVKRCAEEAKVRYDFNHNSYHENDGYEVDKQSILDVANKINKERSKWIK